jgi:peptidoglycan/xylan/chitin deacetylase (PgdA/CDA1 family)
MGLPTDIRVILLYHRVATVESDPFGLAVSPAHFGEHLDVLRETASIMSLSKLITELGAQASERPLAAITFDDGYADVIAHAVERLESAAIPATFFLTTSTLGHQEFWWDQLERLVLQPTVLPSRLHLDINDASSEWLLGDDGPWWRERFVNDPSWRTWHPDAPSTRHALYASLWKRCQPLSPEERELVLGQLRRAAGGDHEPRQTHWSMTVDDARRLLTRPFFEVGAHTLTHAHLASSTAKIQGIEILESKSWLEHELGHEVTIFSYPYGGATDYTDDSVRLAREAGYIGACLSTPGPLGPHTDRFRLPRLFVHDWDGDEFRRQLMSSHA